MRFAVTATSEAMFKIHPLLKIPASFFCREAEVLFGALKTKSCLSEASSFCLAETAEGIAKKVQPVPFLCFVSFGQAKEMKGPCGQSTTIN